MHSGLRRIITCRLNASGRIQVEYTMHDIYYHLFSLSILSQVSVSYELLDSRSVSWQPANNSIGFFVKVGHADTTYA
jgi:hypothetical protein